MTPIIIPVLQKKLWHRDHTVIKWQSEAVNLGGQAAEFVFYHRKPPVITVYAIVAIEGSCIGSKRG